MTRHTEIARAVRYAILMGSVAVATATSSPAQAQVQAQATDQEATAKLETIVVTGSRIPQPQLESVSPVTVVGSEEIQQTGITKIEDLLNTLPQVMADYGANVSNGATGEATVSLYGLGAARTLVLINGRRLMPGDPTQNGNAAPDLNQIPSALVERVDVLTGGASAVYGADAVAGAVNFVMNDHFQGVRVDATYSFYNHHNGETYMENLGSTFGITPPPSTVNDGYNRDFTILAGGNFADGRGNATVYAGYRRADAVTQGRRDFSKCSLSTGSGLVSCGGSATAARGFFNTPNGLFTVGPGGFVPAVLSGPNTSLYNYAPANYYQRPDERYTAGAFVHYDINDHARAYMEFMFMDDRSIAQIAPSGAFYNQGTGTTAGVPDSTWEVNCNNPYLSANEYTGLGCTSPADVVHALFGRRNVEGGPRYDDLGHTSFRTVVGIKGDINSAWTYDAYAQNGITRLSEEYFNDVSKSRISYALQAVPGPNGSVVCAANAGGANGAPGCVPWNIFQLGGVTPAAVNYISAVGLSKGATTERVVSASVTGDLGKQGVQLPTAHHGLGVSFGTEYRSERTELEPDQEFITNDLAGQGAPTLPTNGSFHVFEGFMEARLPILEDLPLAKSLSVEAGYRYSDYNLSFGSTNTFKFGLEWAPVGDVRLRAMFNRAVRAPNLQDLFLQPRVQLDGTVDPCAGATPNATLAQCELTGATAAEYGHIAADPAHQYNGLVGGSTSLAPEVADTYTVGFVVTPTVLPNFNATVDYYSIKINNFITSYGANFIIGQCINTANPFYCDKVHRAPATGTASDGSLFGGTSSYIVDTIYNLGWQRAQGIDITSAYKWDLGRAGKLDFDFVANYDIKYATETVLGLGSYNCAGYYGATCGVPAAKWKHKLRATWRTPVPSLDAWIAWRKISGVAEEHTSSNPLLSGPTSPYDGAGSNLATQPGTWLTARHYIDLGASWTAASKYTLRAGVNNLFDKDPPLVSLYYLPTVFGNGNTLPQVYDTLGRYIFVSLTADF
jgi:iron complex outermembrane recepter protein